jgi:hypothetical protein
MKQVKETHVHLTNNLRSVNSKTTGFSGPIGPWSSNRNTRVMCSWSSLSPYFLLKSTTSGKLGSRVWWSGGDDKQDCKHAGEARGTQAQVSTQL